MRTYRGRLSRIGAVAAATLISVAGLGAIGLISATPAGATPPPGTATEQYFGFPGPTGFSVVNTIAQVGSPATASQGSNFAVTIQGGSQVVPTTNSGVPVNYISNNAQYYEIPAGSTYVSNVVSGPLTWTGGPGTGGIPASGSGPVSAIECVSAATPGCTAASNSVLAVAGGVYSGFAGPNPTYPYLEVTTGATKIPAGATLVLPNVTVTLTASGAVASTINWSQFEFDTSANVTLFGSPVTAAVVGYPTSTTFCNTVPNVPPVTGCALGPFTTSPFVTYLAPPILTSTVIGAPAPFINVTNAPPINIPGTGTTTINVTGANWPVSTTGTLTWSGGPGANTDHGTFTVSAAGALTGTIPLSLAEQLATSSSPITLTLTATDGAVVKTTTVTVNPFQAFNTSCTIGTVHGASCSINQNISATVVGTNLTISEVATGTNTSSSAVVLSPVTLGLGAGTNNQQFDQALGYLNTVVVSDDRGTLTGWSVTGQLGGDFTNATPHGPALDNTIPADFLTWQPAVALETAGTLPGNNANTPGCPDQTPAPPGYPSCTGPSGLPVPLVGTAQGVAGSTGVNGTGAGTGGVSTTPAEVTAGNPGVLNNPAGSSASLCKTGTAAAPGGGGGFLCEAGLSLAIPPYVAAGTYSATLNIVVIGY
jgi:hypothetical protein